MFHLIYASIISTTLMRSSLSSSPLLVSKHIIFRPIVPMDAFLYHRWLQNPDFLAYKPYLKRLCPTPIQLSTHLTIQAEHNPRTEFEVLAIQQKSKTPIGILGLSGIDEFNQKAEFSAGFICGYGTRSIWEAIHAGIDISFTYSELQKLICYVTSNNHRVLKILQRYGLTHEGYFKEEILVDNKQRIDLHRFALIRRDWQQHPLHQRLRRIAPVYKKLTIARMNSQ